MDSVSEPEATDNGKKQHEVCWEKKNYSLSYIFVEIEFGLWAIGSCLRVKPRDFHLCSSGQYQGIQDTLHGVEQLASNSVDFWHV